MITPELISQVGFPIAVVTYLLWERRKITTELIEKIENKNSELVKAITSLKEAIIKMEGKLLSK